MSRSDISALLEDAKAIACRYRQLTGKPLGITGEVAEVTAAGLLELDLTEARKAGYDATRVVEGDLIRYQIKGRVILPDAKPGQRIGSIRLDHEWDCVLLVLLDEHYNATAVYEADRLAVKAALLAPGSKSRNERGALSVSKFKSIGSQVWPLGS